MDYQAIAKEQKETIDRLDLEISKLRAEVQSLKDSSTEGPLPYSQRQYPTRQDMRLEITRLWDYHQNFKKRLRKWMVRRITNGSEAYDSFKRMREATAREAVMIAALEEISEGCDGDLCTAEKYHKPALEALSNASPAAMTLRRVYEAAKDVLAVRGKDLERSNLPDYMERPFSVLAQLINDYEKLLGSR